MEHLEFANALDGTLRYHLECRPNGLSDDAIDLLVDIAARYCAPPRKKRGKP